MRTCDSEEALEGPVHGLEFENVLLPTSRQASRAILKSLPRPPSIQRKRDAAEITVRPGERDAYPVKVVCMEVRKNQLLRFFPQLSVHHFMLLMD